VEYSVVQSSFFVEMSSSWGSSIPLSTSKGICGSHIKIRSSVVCETERIKSFFPLKYYRKVPPSEKRPVFSFQICSSLSFRIILKKKIQILGNLINIGDFSALLMRKALKSSQVQTKRSFSDNFILSPS